MKINIEWFAGAKPQFNVNLATKEGAEPFVSIKGCRIAEGSSGAFVSWPSTKNEQTGKWWRHVYASDAFGAAVLAEAQKSAPKQDTRTLAERKRYTAEGDDIPF